MLSPVVQRTVSTIQPYAVAGVSAARRRPSIWSDVVKTAIPILLTLGSLTAALTLVMRNREFFESAGVFAYPGVFLAEFANSAMLFLPTPWPAYTIAMSVVLNPLVIGLVGGIAAALGELIGYWVGARGRTIIDGGRLYGWLESMTDRWGDKAIFACAVAPIPFDIAGIWAGTVRYPLARFFISVALAKILRIGIASAASHYGMSLFFGPTV